MYWIQTVCIQYILFVFNRHRCKSIPILTCTNHYKPILTNTSWMDWFVLYTNCLYSIHTVCIQTASLWIHTYSNLYRPIQTDTNQYIVNGLVCIESVFRKPIQIQYLYWPKQASIQTCINQNSSNTHQYIVNRLVCIEYKQSALQCSAASADRRSAASSGCTSPHNEGEQCAGWSQKGPAPTNAAHC